MQPSYEGENGYPHLQGIALTNMENDSRENVCRYTLVPLSCLSRKSGRVELGTSPKGYA